MRTHYYFTKASTALFILLLLLPSTNYVEVIKSYRFSDIASNGYRVVYIPDNYTNLYDAIISNGRENIVVYIREGVYTWSSNEAFIDKAVNVRVVGIGRVVINGKLRIDNSTNITLENIVIQSTQIISVLNSKNIVFNNVAIYYRRLPTMKYGRVSILIGSCNNISFINTVFNGTISIDETSNILFKNTYCSNSLILIHRHVTNITLYNMVIDNGLLIVDATVYSPSIPYNIEVINTTVNGYPLVCISDKDFNGANLKDYYSVFGELILFNVSNLVISDYSIYDRLVSIIIVGSHSIRIRDNTFYPPQNYTLDLYSSISVYHSQDIVVDSNRICSSVFTAIYFFNVSSFSITNNYLSNNGWGILMYESSNGSIMYNEITNNRLGVDIKRCKDIVIALNNFCNKASDLRIESLHIQLYTVNEYYYVYNGYLYKGRLGNFWCSFSGVDSNGDGVIDSVYTVMQSPVTIADEYPLYVGIDSYKIIGVVGNVDLSTVTPYYPIGYSGGEQGVSVQYIIVIVLLIAVVAIVVIVVRKKRAR